MDESATNCNHTPIIEEARSWYQGNHSRFEECEKKLTILVKDLLQIDRLAYVSLDSRVKKESSFIQKLRDKLETNIEYDYTKMHDILGLRILVYVLSDEENIAAAVLKEFEIDNTLSENKAQALDRDRCGYRGLQLICSLRTDRTALKEYSLLDKQLFEIQIRTLCANAWAVLYHPSYKLKGGLPKEQDRELYMLSGLLEIADRQFDSLVKFVDEYKENIEREISTPGASSTFELDSISLLAELRNRFTVQYPNLEYRKPGEASQIIAELKSFGITNPNDAADLVDLQKVTLKRIKFQTVGGLMRFAMIIKDAAKYFARSWNRDWNPAREIRHIFPQLLIDGVDVSIISNACRDYTGS